MLATFSSFSLFYLSVSYLKATLKTYQVLFKFLNSQETNFIVSKQIYFSMYTTCVRPPGRLIDFFYLKLYWSNHQHHQLHFFVVVWNCYFLIMAIPLLSSWRIVYKPRKYYIHVVSSVLVLHKKRWGLFVEHLLSSLCRGDLFWIIRLLI